MVFVLVGKITAMLCDKPDHPQTQWYITAIYSHVHESAEERGLFGLKRAQVGYSTMVLGSGLLCVFFAIIIIYFIKI